MTRVAVDLLGGDSGPDVVADALVGLLDRDRLDSLDAYVDDLSVCIVGPEDLTERLFAERGIDLSEPSVAAQVLHAGECVPMTASSHDTLTLLRERTDLSSIVGVESVRRGIADAFVSIGHTGATVAASVLRMGRLPGMGRPGLAVELPSASGPVVLVDCGAAPHATAQDLLRFASAGMAYAASLGITLPRVGLLSLGSERGKGDHLRKAADALLEDTFGAQYAGPVEGHDLVGECPADVVVVDGFTGNIALKSMEGALRWSVGAMARAYGSDGPARELLRTSHFLSGGVLLGVPGAIVVGHGASSVPEVIACIQRAANLHTESVVDKVRSALGAFAPLDARGELIEESS